MGCIDKYYEDCLSENDRKIFEMHVIGARHTFKFLCDDPGFQAGELLIHERAQVCSEKSYVNIL